MQCTSCSSVFVEETLADQTLVRSVVHEISVAGQSLVSGPGIHKSVSTGLLVAAALYAVGTLLAVLINVLGLGLDDAIASGMSVWRLQLAYGNVGLILCMIYLVISGAVVAGALALRNERHYRFGFIAAVLVTAPLFPPYSILLTPVGIWALIALSRNRFQFL